MFRNVSIAVRMTVLILAGAGCILGALIGYSYVSARRLLEEELREKAQYLADATACRIEVVERAVEKVVQSGAFMLEDREWDLEERYRILTGVVERNPEIFGAAIAPSPHGPAPYVCRAPDRSGEVVRRDLSAEEYNYEIWDWFTLPRDLGRAVWTEPYFDEGGGDVLMVTYSVPLRRPGYPGEFAGVLTSDVALEWLREMIASLTVGEAGYAFLISANGTFVSHPVAEMIMSETVFSAAEDREYPLLREIGRSMMRGETGFVPFNSLANGKESWLAYAPVRSTGWSVGLVFPREEILAVVLRLSREVFGLGAIGFALLLGVALGIARSITRPLRELEAATRTLSKGQLDVPLPAIQGDDEVAHLATSFDTMRRDLKRYVEDLRSTTAAKERIESEVHIAHSIQMSLVPRTFPPFPERHDVEIFAILEPAREIGGDFYDFFLDDDWLYMVAGDVSGKGIPAALFMAVTRTFLRSIWHELKEPGPTLVRLNNELARDNDSSMFVTLFCARVHLPTGRCDYANGGHNPPYRLRPGGEVEEVPRVKGAVVGGLEDLRFEEGSLTFEPGEVLYLYTDGVTEAMDPEDRLSGDTWLKTQLGGLDRQADCTKIVREMRERLRVFTRGAEQSDDITMLAFRYLGGGS